MAFKLAEAYVQFSERGSSAVRGAVSAVTGSFTGALGVVRRFSGTLGALGAGAGASGLLKLASDMETTKAKFEVLLGSGDRASAIMDDINQFANSTPFDNFEVAGATQLLIGYNMEADQALQTVRMIGDVAAGSGTGLSELARIYGKIGSDGKLQIDDLNQLQERSIPIVDALAIALQRPRAAIRNLASSGRITQDHLTAAFRLMTSESGRYESGMKRLSETAAGKLSTMVGTIKVKLAELGTPFLKLSKQAMDWVTAAVESSDLVPVMSAIAGRTQAVVTTLRTGAASLLDFFAPVRPLIGATLQMLSGFADSLREMWATAFRPVREVAAAAFRTLQGETGSAFSGVIAMGQQMISGVSRVFGSLLGITRPIFEGLGRLISSEFGTAVNTVQTIVRTVSPVLSRVASLLSSLGTSAAPVVARGFGMIAVAVSGASSVLQRIIGNADALIASFFGMSILDVATALFQNVTTVGAQLADLLLSGLKVGWDITVEVVNLALQALTQTVDTFNGLWATVSGGQTIFQSLSSAWTAFTDLFFTAGQSITETGASLIEGLRFVSRNFSNLWQLTVEYLSIGIQNAVGRMQTFGQNVGIILSWLGSNWRTIFTDMMNFTATVLMNIGENLSNFMSAVKSWLSGDGFNFEFKSLTEGFEAETELPELEQHVAITTSAKMERLTSDIARDELSHEAQQRADAAAKREQEQQKRKQADAERLAEQEKTDEKLQSSTDSSAKAGADAVKKAEQKKRDEAQKTGKVSISSAEEVFKRTATAVTKTAEDQLPVLNAAAKVAKPGQTSGDSVDGTPQRHSAAARAAARAERQQRIQNRRDRAQAARAATEKARAERREKIRAERLEERGQNRRQRIERFRASGASRLDQSPGRSSGSLPVAASSKALEGVMGNSVKVSTDIHATLVRIEKQLNRPTASGVILS